MGTVYRIELPGMTAGVVVEREGISDLQIVTEAAPILHWARGLSLRRLADWVARKHGRIVKVEYWEEE